MFEGGAGAGPMRGELIIHASVLTQDEATHLAAPAASAAWVLEHIFYDYDETPVSWGRFVCRGERLQFRAGVGVQTPGDPPGRRRTRR